MDTQAPTAPAALAGAFSGGALTLSWQGSTDNVGVDHYELYLNGIPLTRVAAGTTSVRVRAFDTNGESIYTVRAFDTAGNQSAVLSAVDVAPVTRPKTAPTRIPRWAWRLLRWQEQGGHSPRPKTPNTLPAWYALWTAWRREPFRLAA